MGKAKHCKADEQLIRDCRIHTEHEAGHAVVAYWFGWWLNPDGVEIDDRMYCGARALKLHYTIEARLVQAMAGNVAEDKFYGGNTSKKKKEDVLELLKLAREGIAAEELDDSDPDIAEYLRSDLGVSVATLVQDNPEISDNECMKALRMY